MADTKQRPWIAGIVDTLVGAHVLMRTTIPHRNRLAVILIDSAFETACRAYASHVAKVKRDEAHRHRENIVKLVRGHLKDIDMEVWENINFYYTDIRNDLYHETASKTITDVVLLDYLDAVEFVINSAFNIGVAQLVTDVLGTVERALPAGAGPEAAAPRLPSLHELTEELDKVLVAVATVTPKSAADLNALFKRQGDSTRLKPKRFTDIVARNSGSKKFYFYSREDKAWKLSTLGMFRLGELQGGSNHE